MNLQIESNDVWTYLNVEKKNGRPIVIYGMGNGADKIITELDKRKIKFDDIMASDDFVRGHSFHGIKVKKLNEIELLHDNPIILIAFGTNRPAVIQNILKISEEHEVLVPDVPLYGEEVFDLSFLQRNYKSIESAFNLLSNDYSKKLFKSIINFKITGKLDYIINSYNKNFADLYETFQSDNYKKCIDAGAYNGDTSLQMLKHFKNVEKIYSFEPDKHNFKKLSNQESVKSNNIIEPINAAISSDNIFSSFNNEKNRNSSLSPGLNNPTVRCVSVDSFFNSVKIDFMKFDVEGSETAALMGSQKTIKTFKPDMIISLYHRSKDLFEIPELINSYNPDYYFFIDRPEYIPAWDVVLICKNYY